MCSRILGIGTGLLGDILKAAFYKLSFSIFGKLFRPKLLHFALE